jgi:hypothetical protein
MASASSTATASAAMPRVVAPHGAAVEQPAPRGSNMMTRARSASIDENGSHEASDPPSGRSISNARTRSALGDREVTAVRQSNGGHPRLSPAMSSSAVCIRARTFSRMATGSSARSAATGGSTRKTDAERQRQ